MPTPEGTASGRRIMIALQGGNAIIISPLVEKGGVRVVV
jgi:hypothetical protein